LKTPGQRIHTSAHRLEDAEGRFHKSGDPVWIGFLKRESGILLRRVIKFWFNIRFRRRKWREENTKSN
jgi:hypothetical protein